MNAEIRIYVTCLAAYKSGHLHGVWVDATQALDDIQNQVSAMLPDSPMNDVEEYAIHDYEGFGSYKISEHQGLKSINDIACFIEEYGAVGAEILSYACGDINDAENIMINQRSGKYESVADFAEQLTTETSEVPKQLEYCIDYERIGRDMELSGDIFTVETGFEAVHVFWNH